MSSLPNPLDLLKLALALQLCFPFLFFVVVFHSVVVILIPKDSIAWARSEPSSSPRDNINASQSSACSSGMWMQPVKSECRYPR
jgi:hypothetical protein